MTKDKCTICNEPLVPDEEAVILGTKEWDGHTYKFSCSCYDKNIRVAIG